MIEEELSGEVAEKVESEGRVESKDHAAIGDCVDKREMEEEQEVEVTETSPEQEYVPETNLDGRRKPAPNRLEDWWGDQSSDDWLNDIMEKIQDREVKDKPSPLDLRGNDTGDQTDEQTRSETEVVERGEQPSQTTAVRGARATTPKQWLDCAEKIATSS